jgi:hypothetical protein
MIFAGTFGQRYRRKVHPAGSWVHPDGYVVIEALDEKTAREIMFVSFGDQWATLYTWERFCAACGSASVFELFPRGELCRIIREVATDESGTERCVRNPAGSGE